jgi:signal transduction histidine kinase
MSTPIQASEAIRPTEAARLELTRFVPQANHTLRDVFRRACELSARAMGVERVGVWLHVDNNTAIRCANLFELSKNEHSEGAILLVADFPGYFAALKSRKAIPAELATSDPRTAELADAYLRPLNISSMLDAGIRLNGELVGVICHECVGPPREWTTEMRDFAGSIADLIALKMSTAALNELKDAFRRQEERMIALEKADALAQMAAGIAHDFNNLLAAISGTAELLAATPELTRDARDDVGQIADAARRGAELVKELLEFARANGGKPVALNVADSVEGFLPVLRAAVGATHPIQFGRPAAVGQVLIDKNDFTRLLLNLVVNARDAMQQGGPIRIVVAPVKIKDAPGPASHFVFLEVADQGVGMSADLASRVFEPFFTTKAKGTGLGLAIVRRVVDRVGGFLRVNSAPGAGTKMQVYLPRVSAPSTGDTVEHAVPPELLRRTP